MARLIKIADWGNDKRGNAVFVHGLGGHPYHMWQHRTGQHRAASDTFWPVWLAEDVKGLSVYTLGYHSPPTNWLGTSMPLLDEAAHLLRVLLVHPDLQTGPIAFVCHSLGGLIVKQMPRAAREQQDDPRIASFYDRTRQVIFIATPHTGAGKATLMQRAGFIAWGSDSARDLVANRPELRDLNFGYRELARLRGDTLRHLSYYEMVSTLVGRIVEPASADPGLVNCRPTPIRSNHITIAKPRRRDDLVYSETKALVSCLVREPDRGPNPQGAPTLYPLEPFAMEWSWQQLVPKLVRAAVLCLLAAGMWLAVSAISDTQRSITTTEQHVIDVKKGLDDIKVLLAARSPAQAPSLAEREIDRTVDAIAQGAAEGDKRLQEALDLLRAGKVAEARPVLQAVADDKAARIKRDSKEAAIAYRNLGVIAGLGDPKAALDAFTKAEALDPNDIDTLLWIAWIERERGYLAEAEERFQQVLRLAGQDKDSWAWYWARLGLGDVRFARGELTGALADYQDARAIRERLAKADPANAGWQRDLSVSYNKIGDVQRQQGDLAAALRSFQDARAIRERLAKADPTNAGWQRDLAANHALVGMVKARLGKRQDARQAFLRGREIMATLLQRIPDHAAWAKDLAWFNGQISALGQ